jgi:hypothetical protein
MSEPARKIAEQAEERLDRVATAAREKLDTITSGRYTDRIGKGRSAEGTDQGTDPERRNAPGDERGKAPGGDRGDARGADRGDARGGPPA